MSPWFRRIRGWTIPLPSRWGLGQAEVHYSLLITLFVSSVFFLGLSFYRSTYIELRSLVVTLPVVWVVSLAVRLAAQQLAVGKFTEYTETVIGPTGNLRADYEYFPARVAFAYSITGQLVSVGLVALGLVIIAAIMPEVTFARLSELKGGWDSRAWASQIMWLNAFLFGLNLLPTVPFDFRATVYSVFSSGAAPGQESRLYRMIAAFDSHLAALLFGAGVAAMSIQFSLGQEIFGWYAAFAVSAYLIVASQWEAARSDALESSFSQKSGWQKQTRASNPIVGSDRNMGASEARDDMIAEYTTDARDSAEGMLQDLAPRNSPSVVSLDIDEILRKLYRSGRDSLTEEERQALISASQEIQANRESKRR